MKKRLCIALMLPMTACANQTTITPEQAAAQFEASIKSENGQISFVVPADFPKVDAWEIIVAGRVLTEDGMGMSVHLFEEENGKDLWEKGRQYTIAIDGERYTDLLIELVIPNHEVDLAVDRMIDLADYLPEVPANDKTAYMPVTVTFPAYEGGRSEYNGKIYDTPPFQVALELPDGWEVREPEDTDQQSVALFTPLELYSGGDYKGSLAFNVFDRYEEEILQEDFYKTVYPDIRLGSLYSWGDYDPIITTDKTETALSSVSYKSVPDGKSAAEVPYIEVPGILSYDKDRLVYVAIQFAENAAVTDAQVRAIAESIRFQP